MWPQVSFVGATEEQAREAAQKAGYGDKLAVVKTSFRANSKVCIAQGGRVDQHQAEEIIKRRMEARKLHADTSWVLSSAWSANCRERLE